MHKLVLAALLVVVNSACAQNNEALDCKYTDRVIEDIAIPLDGKLVEKRESVDPNSDEPVYTYTILFQNQDSMKVEQKFCDMYNMSVTYRMKHLDRKEFDASLNRIKQIADNAKQDYQLKAPLSAIVDMTMNQRGLSLGAAFDVGLPSQAASSNENVEHSVSFKPLPTSEAYAAELGFYFGIGGE
ncbi:hypothetical protein [uncultured Microbulbifer sp.]|uniref:hypothetical protein n=1 Tax=uncultured Microbulbifer sp. TaxID=348147 RepID=UPI002630126B|nr:hypothetical protein [uncultured Microbulbifer sp.]